MTVSLKGALLEPEGNIDGDPRDDKPFGVEGGGEGVQPTAGIGTSMPWERTN